MGVHAIERILCPTDLPCRADDAPSYAIALARTLGAKLYFFHCAPSLRNDNGGGLPDNSQTLPEALYHNARAAAGALDWEEIPGRGEPEETISRTAAERRIDMIVVQPRQVKRNSTLLGSVAESICRTAPCSVFLVRPRFPQPNSTSGEIPLRKILVAHDFSSDSELALSHASSIARSYGAELHLMYVLPARAESRGDPSDNGSATNLFQRAANGLQNALLSAGPLPYPIEQVISMGKPYLEVLTYAEGQQIDLICMGRFGADFQPRSLFGSNVDRVLRQASCPVLVARPLCPAGPESRPDGENGPAAGR
ncbi:MAG: universal stress protein [Acidobacteria bacterium]|nr:universal stress protein [Acidobacteriota bacterium]